MGTFTEILTVQFFVETCCSCGVQFAFPESYHQEKLKSRGRINPFYCPNGHEQWYVGESDADKFRRERDIARQQLARAEQEAADERQRAELLKKQKKRLEKRASAGTCPCCSRTFSNLSRHMQTKHPEFVARTSFR